MYFKLIYYSQDSVFESFFKIIDSKKQLHRNNFKPATKNNLGEEHFWIQGDNYSLKDNYLYYSIVLKSEKRFTLRGIFNFFRKLKCFLF
jgi:hypothetical protein